MQRDGALRFVAPGRLPTCSVCQQLAVLLERPGHAFGQSPEIPALPEIGCGHIGCSHGLQIDLEFHHSLCRCREHRLPAGRRPLEPWDAPMYLLYSLGRGVTLCPVQDLGNNREPVVGIGVFQREESLFADTERQPDSRDRPLNMGGTRKRLRTPLRNRECMDRQVHAHQRIDLHDRGSEPRLRRYLMILPQGLIQGRPLSLHAEDCCSPIHKTCPLGRKLLLERPQLGDRLIVFTRHCQNGRIHHLKSFCHSLVRF